MNKLKELNSHNSVPRKGVSWRAIFAGVICTFSIVFLFNLLGLSLGFGSIEPMEKSSPFSGVGTLSLVWWAVSNLLALFVGAFVAARVGVSFYQKSGIIQGIMTWALYLILSLWLVTSAVGGVISGVGNTIGNVVSWANEQQELSQSQQLSEQHEKELEVSLNKAKEKFYMLLEEAQKPYSDPQEAENEVEEKMDNSGQQAMRDFGSSAQLDAKIEQIFNEAKNIFDNKWEALDKEALVNILTSRTNFSEKEAKQTVSSYAAEYENLRKQSMEFLENMKQEAEKTAGTISDAMADAALYLFIALLLGAIVGALGGAAGVKSLRSDYMEGHYLNSSEDSQDTDYEGRT
ncbi:hypothetical protein [Salinimicrobium sp. TH3]|uniref:hypothetical protein n=1 Tax=Salinimicrobium sp. TH3 TaxID=2997342 RepID=UPI0022759458|nr:hypothetical protein [Salinimicrobium sp. TH3]MCY2687213.1 hypothetical protein [Salinimicrobium sp. TH3]